MSSYLDARAGLQRPHPFAAASPSAPAAARPPPPSAMPSHASSGDDRFADADDDATPPELAAPPARAPAMPAPAESPPFPQRAPASDLASPQLPSPPAALVSPAAFAPRDRMMSSASSNSLSASMRGRRAPAPAALDLSPRKASNEGGQERARMASLGLGSPPAAQRTDRAPMQHHLRSSSLASLDPAIDLTSRAPRTYAAEPDRYEPPQTASPSSPRIPVSVSMPLSVPLSAVGVGSARDRMPSLSEQVDERRGSASSSYLLGANNMDSRASFDSYYMGSTSMPNDKISPPTQHQPAFSPTTPEWPDPSRIDRRGLVGTGELATPRWASSTHHQHMRTPNMPNDSGPSPPMPPMPDHVAAYNTWSKAENGMGLGVGVMASVDESPRRERPRHKSMSADSPSKHASSPALVPAPMPADSTYAKLDQILDGLGKLSFDSNVESGLAATLSLPNAPDTSPARSLARQSAPPAPRLLTEFDERPAFAASPGSARERIYARRASRQAASMAQEPGRDLSKLSPPTSADSTSQSFSHRLSRDARKTPPNGKERERDTSLSSKRRAPVSPNAPHHDILKHIAPKDFSHLPPSPSSASINQFLRASGSTKDVAAALRSPGQASAHTPSGLGRSDSQRRRADFDTQTAEAIRKLDGLSSTPKRASVKSKASSRPGTPPTSAKSDPPARPALTTKTSTSSFGPARDKDSPLGNWVDIANELAAGSAAGYARHDTLVPDRADDYKRTSSASSFVGTPTSRDSHPTTSTTPSSTSGQKAARRQSGQSDVSSVADGSDDRVEGSVPPVPPLPRGYMSMRQGLSTAAQPVPTSYVPLRDAPQEESPVAGQSPQISVSAQSEDSSLSRPRTMSKKWSFSSALSLKLHKDSSSPASSPAMPSTEFEAPPSTAPSSPHTPWTQVERRDLPASPGPQLPPPPPHASLEPDQRSNKSLTPIAQGLSPNSAAAPTFPDGARHSSKRLTPSSIPFFRRSSSTLVQAKTSPPVPETPKAQASSQRTPSGSTVKKSVFGMLRGSVSKKGHGQAEKSPPETKVDETSVGWGRRRGRTVSIADAPPDHLLMPKSSVESSLSHRGSAASNGSESTVGGPRTALPAIVGSPALHTASSTSSLRNRPDPRVPTSTPTKIPRAALRPVATTPGGHSSMPPPAVPITASQSGNVYSGTGTPLARGQASYGTMPSARTMANTASVGDLSRPAVNEFGVVTGTTTPRQTTSSAHRNHLLQPMSTRPQERKASGSSITSLPPAAAKAAGQPGPPSRRALPQPPSTSTLTALTASAAAKRTSRDAVRPGLSRRGSSSTNQDDSASDVPSMKQSKSLHAKLGGAPGSSKLSSSSSMGATAVRRASLLTSDSPSVSPADDEESVADAEMAAYVKRRQARSAASGGKKDDLSDLIGFPEDTAPAQPLSQRAFISKHLATLSDYERKEVLDYDDIYFAARNVTRPAQAGGVYNSGYDDERGDYLVVAGDHLCYRYEVIGVLGKGSFGQVVQCRDHKTGGSVAVKIIRNKKRFHAQALVEVKILTQIIEWDPEDRHYMVKMTDHFYFRGHLCIVTELLSINLYELIKLNQFNGFSTALCRRFTTQMLAGLQLMRSHRIVHCDLKPENILLKHPAKSGLKTIDFGSSCHETEKVYTYIQSRFYRSPEVILGMNYAMAIDMWSLGCILAELYTGFPIFPGENEHEQLACIMEVLGVPDKYLVDRASRRKLFFDATGAPRPFVNAKGKRRRPSSKTLAQVLKCNDELFVDFIAKCLTWDPDKRLKPQPAMRHPWILAGRRRAPPPRPEERRSLLSAASSSGLAPASARPARASKDADRKAGLVISPPTPLVARQAAVPSSAPRIGPSASSARLGHQPRAYIPTNAQKISLA